VRICQTIDYVQLSQLVIFFKRRKINELHMQKYVCEICGYIYDPEKGDPDSGIEPGTPFEEIPEDWSCPQCSATKSQFEPMKQESGVA